MKITEFISDNNIVEELHSKKKEDVIKELAKYIANNLNGTLRLDEIVRVIMDREKLESTAIGNCVAIPHGRIKGLKKMIGVIGRSKEGVEFNSKDGKPVHLIFLLLAPENSSADHLRALAIISRICKDKQTCERILKAKDKKEIYRIVEEKGVE